MSYRVITPAGVYYVKSAQEAKESGFPYVKTTKSQLDPIDREIMERDEEQEAWEREMYG